MRIGMGPGPIRALYTYAVILSVLFVMAFVWLFLNEAVASIRAGIVPGMTQYENHTNYQTFVLADVFVGQLWTLFLFLVIIGLAYWVFIYSQRRKYVGGY